MSLTLNPVDVELLDRLAELEGSNRSEEVRRMLAQVRPMMRGVVEAMEGAVRSRDALLDEVAKRGIGDLEALVPEMERIQAVALGAMARIEGAAAAREALDPRASNTGVTPPTPPAPWDDSESESGS